MNRAISRRYNAVPKVVISDRGPVPSGNPWALTTTLVPRHRVRAWVEQARQGDGGDVVVFGSRRMWNGLLADGLVDELHLMVSPTVLSDGVRLFGTPAQLELIACRLRRLTECAAALPHSQRGSGAGVPLVAEQDERVQANSPDTGDGPPVRPGAGSQG